MKTIVTRISIAIFTMICLSCSNDDNTDTTTTTIEFSPEQINGVWRISFFSDENGERTLEFNTYQFIFNLTGSDTGDVSIISNGNTVNDGFDLFEETNDNVETWILELTVHENPGDADLFDLNEDWIMTRVNDNGTYIEFEEQDSNNSPEILHLIKLEN